MRTFLTAVGACLMAMTGSSIAADFRLETSIYGNNTIHISGAIMSGDYDAFRSMAETVSNATISLNSPGGSVTEGLAIGAEIAQRGFDTYVGEISECYSICAIIWVGGAARRMHVDATIGVHAAYRNVAQADGSEVAQEVGSANADIGAYLNQLGLHRQAVLYFTTAGPQETFPVTPAIARQLDLGPFVFDGREWQTPQQYPSPRRLVLHTSQYIGLSSNCSDLFDIDAGEMEALARSSLKRAHDTYGPDSTTSLISEYAVLTREERAKLGLVRWCISTEIELRDQGLPTGISGPAFPCSKAGTSTERAICQSTDLWTMDRAMSNLYSMIRRHNPNIDRAAFLDDQRAWLRRRDRCGGDQNCIAQSYLGRLMDFNI